MAQRAARFAVPSARRLAGTAVDATGLAGDVGRTMNRVGLVLLLLASLLLAGCASFAPDRLAECVPAMPPIDYDPATGEASTRLSVLTYNVEGLPWPARRSRSRQLDEIGGRLAAMRERGEAPDVVLLQEVFTSAAGRIAERSGYTNRVRGPGRRTPRQDTSEAADPALVDNRKLLKGERFGRLLSSGLYILSDYPVIASAGQPFRRRECAGFDCMANKGVQHVRIAIPGVPGAVDLFNTHLNSGRSSRVGRRRSLRAHRLQVEEVARFIAARRDQRVPMIYGGDLNMRHNDQRFAHFDDTVPHPLVHRHCTDPAAGCKVAISWDDDAPWLDTQDHQGFADGTEGAAGTAVTVRPVRVEAMFDAPWRGARLADHDGLLVTYRLSWRSPGPAMRLASLGPAIPLCRPLPAPGSRLGG